MTRQFNPFVSSEVETRGAGHLDFARCEREGC